MRARHASLPLLGLIASVLMCTHGGALAAADGPEADPAETETRPTSAAVARRPDERRPAVSHELMLFGLPVQVSGEYELTLQSRGNHDLDESRARDRDELGQELKLEAMFSPAARTTVFLQMTGVSEIETRRENGPVESFGALKRDQMWIYLERPANLPLDLQVGRLSLVETRSWWWDDDLDAARIFLAGPKWAIETGLAQRVMPVSTDERGIDPEAEDLARWFGRAVWVWRKRHNLEAYWLLARDHSGRAAPDTVLHERRADEVDAHLNWLGIRAIGEERIKGGHRLGYWIDAARVSGRETLTDFDGAGGDLVVVNKHERQRVSGVGWDIGANWTFPGKARPTVWAGWAVGSGDSNPDDGTEHSFRQTGLEENKGRVGGVKRFRYYGELMRPTLSNLSIRSLGASLRFFDKSSIDVVLHDYRQRQASDQLADSRINDDPNGESRALGQELDVFLAFRESPSTEFIVSLATFRAGSAFGKNSGERAWYAELGMTVNF